MIPQVRAPRSPPVDQHLGVAVIGLEYMAQRLEFRPQFAVVLTASSLGRAAVAALAMALLAAIIPARRLAALEPAVAYRSAP